MVSLTAGDHAIQFGMVENHGSLNIQREQKQGILQLQIGSIVGGEINFHTSSQDLEPKLRALPLHLEPRPFPGLIGRQEELQKALTALCQQQPTEFHGVAGIGKTVLLRHLAHHSILSSAFPDGMIYHNLDRHRTVSDLLQELFNAFYESNLPLKLSDIQIRGFLQQRRALILLDDISLGRSEVEALLNAVPGCTFLLALPDRQLWGEGVSIEVQGLPATQGVELVAKTLGRSLNPNEIRAAETLCVLLKGHPLSILQVVAQTQAEQNSLVAIVQALQPMASKGRIIHLFNRLKRPQQLIIAVLAALGANVALGAELITAISKLANAPQELAELVRTHLLQQVGDRYRLDPTITETLQQSDLTAWKERLADYFQDWLRSPQTSLVECRRELDAMLQILDWAAVSQRWTLVLGLGSLLEGILAVSGRWDEWQHVLRLILTTARQAGDRAWEALALHQLGTRTLAQGNLTEAQTLLTEALHLREALNDVAGLAVTRHNLDLLTPAPSPSRPDREPTHVPSRKPLWASIIGAVILLLMAGIWLPKLFAPGQPDSFLPLSISIDVPPTPGTATPKKVTLKLDKTTVRPAETLTGTLTLDVAAPSTGTKVILESSDEQLATVKPEITIQPGMKTVLVTVQIPKNAAKGKQVKITPSLNGLAGNPVTLTIQDDKKTTAPVPKQVTLTLDKTTGRPGEAIFGELTLDVAAPANGILIALESSNPALATVPLEITIPAGKTAFPVRVNIPEKAASGKVTITPSQKGLTGNPVELTIEADKKPDPEPSVTLQSLQLQLDDGLVVGTLQLTAPAPAKGVLIKLSSSHPDLSRAMPIEVSVPPNAGSAEFSFAIPNDRPNYPNGTALTITASDGKSQQSDTVRIPPSATIPANLTDLQLSQQEIGRGQAEKSVDATIVLDSPAPAGGISVNLVSSRGLVQVPATVTIPGGKASQTVSLTIPAYQKGDNYPTPTTVEVTASYAGVTRTQRLLVYPPTNQPSTRVDPSATRVVVPSLRTLPSPIRRPIP